MKKEKGKRKKNRGNYEHTTGQSQVKASLDKVMLEVVMKEKIKGVEDVRNENW
jgi:hypothetical protein